MTRYLPLVVLVLGCDDAPFDQHRVPLADYAITAIDVDSDGRLIALADPIDGAASSVVLRMDRSGVLDPTFGLEGIAVLDEVSATTALAIVDGAIRIAIPQTDELEPAIIGLDRDGVRDGFTVRLGDLPALGQVQELFAQDDQLVVNAAPARHVAGQLARYRPDGSRDAAFAAPSGVLNVPTIDGTIVCVRETIELDQPSLEIDRLDRDGVEDPTFGGILVTNVGDAVIDVHIADGSLLLGGSASADRLFAVRVLEDATIEQTFNATAHTFPGVGISAIANARDGGAFLFGSTDDRHATAIRLLADGSLDARFGVDGMLVLDDVELTAITTLPDGTIVAASLHDGREPRITLFE